jgi:hypothetical protein
VKSFLAFFTAAGGFPANTSYLLSPQEQQYLASTGALLQSEKTRAMSVLVVFIKPTNFLS